MAKRATAQGVSALLRKAGFQRAQSRASGIRGLRKHSEGFKVTRGYPESEVEVEYQPDSFRTPTERFDEMLGQYERTIVAAGFAVKRREQGAYKALIVTASDGEEV
jgi:hypothetical protein